MTYLIVNPSEPLEKTKYEIHCGWKYKIWPIKRVHFLPSHIYYLHVTKTITGVGLFKITEGACYDLSSNHVNDNSLTSVVVPLHIEIIAEIGKQLLQEWHTKSYDNSNIKCISI